MRRAKNFSRRKLDVMLYAANYIEDQIMVPDDFISLEPLENSILDFGTFKSKRKLPLISDILHRLYERSEAEYFIYTNVDIALKPDFYSTVNEIIQKGYDAFLINRRTIPNKYRQIEELPFMYKEFGESHPGYDCFVFRRDASPNFRLKNICIGINYVGLALLKNLACHGNKFKIFEDLHLTFHIGNEKSWKLDEYADYRNHNEQEYYKVLDSLNNEFGFTGLESEQPVAEKKSKYPDYAPLNATRFQQLTSSIEKNIFFVLSSGRSGTQTIAKTLSELPDCICLHEPAPELILESSAYRYGEMEYEKINNILRTTRKPVLNGKTYGESNQTLSLIVPVLASTFPNAKFIWLIRNGLDVVSSIYSRQWYTGHSANHEHYENCPPLEKAWIDGRIMGDRCGDVPLAKWESMNSFARCCWYWSYINRTIERDIGDCCSIESCRKIKIEKLDRDLPELVDWLGFKPASDLIADKHNRAHYSLYPWQKWTWEEKNTFLYWCGPMMDRLYPDWRYLYREFFNAPEGSPQSIKAPVGNNLDNSKNFNEVHPKRGNQEAFNIYFTPQLKAHPKVSVYITSYNQKEYLVEAIESVLAQTLTPHEIIITDDSSHDGSQEVIAQYALKYPNLIFPIYHTQNLGVVQTRIDSLNAVTGDFVTYVDGDDRLLPEKLECELDILAENETAAIAYSNNYYINPDGQRIGIWADKESPPQGYIFKETFGRHFPKNNLFRMELINYQALKAVGFHNPAITIYEDFDIRIRLTKHFKVAFCDAPLSEIRMHDMGLSNLDARQHLASLEFLYHHNKPLLADLSSSDREIVNSGFDDFMNKISLHAATQIGAEQIIIKDHSGNLPSTGITTNSNRDPSPKSNELGANLIFLISQPRAGSTLVQRILSGHPAIHTTAEPWIMLHPMYALKETGVEAEYRSNLARMGLEDFLVQIPEGQELYISALRKMGHTLYNRMLEISGKKFFLDKTPRYYHIIPELYCTFPEAKFIFLLRNPIAVLSSVLKTWFENRFDHLRKPNLIDLMKGPTCLLDGIKLLKEKAIVVEYESLVRSPECVIQRVCNRIGVPYDPQLLDYGQRPAPHGKFGDSVGIHKYRRPVTENIDKWQNNLSTLALIEFADQYLKSLGSKIVSKMGYNYIELLQELSSSLNDVQGPIDTPIGIYADGWTGPQVYIFYGAGKENRIIEFRFEVPQFVPTGSVKLELRCNGSFLREWIVDRGKQVSIRHQLPTAKGHLAVVVTPTFQPSECNMGPDNRRIGVRCHECCLVSPEQERTSLLI